MFCPYCGSKKTDGVDVCPVCGGVDPAPAQGYDDSEEATRLIQGAELNALEQKMNQGFQNQNVQQNMQWQQSFQGFPMGQLGQTQWENPQPAPKSNNKGLIIALIIVAVLLIGGGLTAFFLLRGGSSTEVTEDTDGMNREDDIAAAETINTACQAALANEDAYDEVQGVMPNSGYVVVATAAGGESFRCVNNGVSNNGLVFLSEVNSSVNGSAPKIKYKKDGANYWTVGVSEVGKPVVWLGTSEGDTTWELQPDIDEEYK